MVFVKSSESSKAGQPLSSGEAETIRYLYSSEKSGIEKFQFSKHL